jgi:acid phosphatase type 7
MHRLAAAMAAASLLAACSGSPSGPSMIPGVSSSIVVVAAGDIASCEEQGSQLTAMLLDGISGTVLTLGDNAYPHGTIVNYATCYEPTWGRHVGRTRPTPGNHEYETPGATHYYSYFGEVAGPPGLGYYVFSLGTWDLIALNSEIDVSAASAQVAWLRSYLRSATARCTLAYFHRPLFSSGQNGNTTNMRDIWRVLYEFNADVVLSAHDHMYERFLPQDPNGIGDLTRGIRQFTVGTGGAERTAPVRRTGNSEITGTDWGVLKLTLGADDYRWEFVPVPGVGFRDTGSGRCH